MAKSLFISLFFSFSFLFSFGLTTQGKSVGKYYITISHVIESYVKDVTGSYHMMTSYDKCGKVVHRPYSSCISSI